MKIIMLCGLPGSGKTTWATNRVKKEYHTSVMNFDDFDDLNRIDRTVYDMSRYTDTIIADGLFLTNDVRCGILNKIHDAAVTRLGWGCDDVEIEFHEWKPNREACLCNDEGRRDKDSGITIRNAVWEPVVMREISDRLKFTPKEMTTEYHEVKVWSKKEKFVNKGDDGKIESASWCGGGSWGDCWGNSGTVDGEPPAEFTELDNLLDEVCPNIRFLQYKKLVAECVKTETFYSRDYYGGSTTNYKYVCDLGKLYDYLEEHNMI